MQRLNWVFLFLMHLIQIRVLWQNLYLLRRLCSCVVFLKKNAVVHRGGWNKSAKDSYEVRGKTMGIVGYGSIGSQLSVLAESLGMKVIYHDAMTKLPLGNATQVGSLEELLSKADVVTLHVPDSSSTRNIMTAKAFEQMKDGSFFHQRFSWQLCGH